MIILKNVEHLIVFGGEVLISLTGEANIDTMNWASYLSSTLTAGDEEEQYLQEEQEEVKSIFLVLIIFPV